MGGREGEVHSEERGRWRWRWRGTEEKLIVRNTGVRRYHDEQAGGHRVQFGG